MTALSDADGLFGTEWVHAFERDTAEGEVFVPADADIPLSRRPRQRLVLQRDGTATLLDAGPDDRLVPSEATWNEAGGDVIVRRRSGDEVLRIVSHAPDRLVVRRRT